MPRAESPITYEMLLEGTTVFNEDFVGEIAIGERSDPDMVRAFEEGMERRRQRPGFNGFRLDYSKPGSVLIYVTYATS